MIVYMTTGFFDTVGKRVRALRQDQSMNQTELTQWLSGIGVDINSSYISQIENMGKIPSAEVLVGLARILKTSTDYLLMLTDDPEPPRNSELNVVIQVSGRDERALLEEWAETIQDMSQDQRRSLLETVRLLIGPSKPRIIGE